MFSRKRRECPAWADHRIEQPTGGDAVAKLQAVGDHVLHSQMLRQRTHHLLESLADQNDISATFNQLLYLRYSTRLQAWLQLVLEIFLAQQVEAVAADAAQDGVHHARGKFAIGRVQKRAQQRHQKNQTAPPEAFAEGLSVPGKECHWPNHGQVQQAAFNAPVDGGGDRTGIVI